MLDPAIRKADYLLIIVLHYHDNLLLALKTKRRGSEKTMRTLWMTGFIAAALLLGLSYAGQRLGDPADLVLLDDRIGSIEVGKEADIAMWEQDPLRAPVNVLKDLKCVLTLLKGNIVYRDTQRLP
jgi:Amidohydrolase family